MITKKKLKTKLDYEIRTFGLCALLLFVFTVFFVNPQTSELDNTNEVLHEEIKIEEDVNSQLMFEQESILVETTIKNNE